LLLALPEARLVTVTSQESGTVFSMIITDYIIFAFLKFFKVYKRQKKMTF